MRVRRSIRGSSKFAVLAAVGAVALPLASTARADDGATAKELKAQIDALKSKVDQLEAKEAQSKADTVKAVHDVLEDAERRSKMLSLGGVNGGYDNDRGFFLQSDNGDFSLHPGILFQFRGTGAYRFNATEANSGPSTPVFGTDGETGFEVRRLKLAMDGNMFGHNLTYYFQVSSQPEGGGITLEDAQVQYRLSDTSPFAIKAGQFRDPIYHEASMGDGRLLAADRTLVNSFIGGGQTQRIQGAGLVYDAGRFRGQGILHDGYASQNTNFQDHPGGGPIGSVGSGAGVGPLNWGISVRAEYMVIGDRTVEFNPFSEYDDFTSHKNQQDILVVGGGVDYSEGGANHVIFHTVDVQWENTSGWGVYAAYLGAYRELPTEPGSFAGSYYDSGALAQVSYRLSEHVEPFLRYDYTHLDGGALTGVNENNLHEITIGLNYYLYNNRMKFTLDGTYLPNGAPVDVPALGILKNDGDAEFVVRAQLQLLI